MNDSITIRFTQYLPLLLDALRSTHPRPMRPAEAAAWIRSRVSVSIDNVTRLVENGSQTIFENDVHWARFYLAKANLIGSPRRGLWSLTPEGETTHLSPEDTRVLFLQVREADRLAAAGAAAEETPAPDFANADEDGPAYWFVGAVWNKTDDQVPRFLNEGIWENGSDDQSRLLRRMKAGDRIAIKAAFVQRRALPFDVSGSPVAAMRIKATGTILESSNTGRRVIVAWDPPFAPRDWYFYTYLKTIAEADPESEGATRLVEFTFRGATQDYEWFLKQPYWAEKYAISPNSSNRVPVTFTAVESEVAEIPLEPTFGIVDIIADGSFLSVQELQGIMDRWRSKKNMVLQGPPGTGKTWLAKRLGFALVGSNDRETARSRLRVVQFHPSLAYEDFVRGWRPAGEGRLELVDGVLMQAIEAAKSEPDRPFVLVIEEINRGNPAQIFGEMLTLLEDTKRHPSESIELAYRKPGERVFVPDNLYVIGTMNVADRSLAIVDLALRRRFAFVDLEPTFGLAWRQWCSKFGLDDELLTLIETRITSLNGEITSTISLGAQFRIGHSYVTPNETISDGRAWFRDRIEGEIGPLLDEYWYDAPERAKEARAKLLAHLV